MIWKDLITSDIRPASTIAAAHEPDQLLLTVSLRGVELERDEGQAVTTFPLSQIGVSFNVC